jgi:hypothetical protein
VQNWRQLGQTEVQWMQLRLDPMLLWTNTATSVMTQHQGNWNSNSPKFHPLFASLVRSVICWLMLATRLKSVGN